MRRIVYSCLTFGVPHNWWLSSFSVVRDCRDLALGFDFVDFSFVRKCGNCPADSLVGISFIFLNSD